jgi:hypothetical protein
MNKATQRSQDGLEPFRHGKIINAVVPVKQTTTTLHAVLITKYKKDVTHRNLMA